MKPLVALSVCSLLAGSVSVALAETKISAAKVPGMGTSVPKNFKWPALPKSGFIRGRIATPEDVQKKNAVFTSEDAETGQLLGKPLDITIPQYAFILFGSQRRPAIVVQAEDIKGHKSLAARDLVADEFYTSQIEHFELLGTKPPSD